MRSSALRAILAGHAERERDLVRVRAIRPTDAAGLERFYAALTDESRRTRFLSRVRGLNRAQSVSFCTPDHDHQEGFVAVIKGGRFGEQHIVGHLCLEPDGVDTAEVAIAVADGFQHQGIGRRLMAAGIEWARREQITQLTATMLATNVPINRLLTGLGLSVDERSVGAGVAEITIDLGGQSAAA